MKYHSNLGGCGDKLWMTNVVLWEVMVGWQCNLMAARARQVGNSRAILAKTRQIPISLGPYILKSFLIRFLPLGFCQFLITWQMIY